MAYATLLVNLTLGRPNTRLLGTAVSLADRFGAGVIGFGACRPVHVICRQRKWILGAITSELLAGDRCALIAH